ncbi:unnamed protein product [Blepharisma stoltei]|uniref:Uncharacterized protein n=1 Tax=Blepharisma stoltei TaxID=1481888 RepID=A0AAU9IUR6_9CILI|nr:unnamed protein product [Blepharisma stoltei]
MKNQCYKYPIYEITTSGLTHSVKTQWGFIFPIQTNTLQPFTYNIGRRIFIKSFASIEIKNKEISIDFRDSDGISLLHHKIPISELYEPAIRSYLCDQTVKERNIKHWLSYCWCFTPLYWSIFWFSSNL